jgi:hypothetical protein
LFIDARGGGEDVELVVDLDDLFRRRHGHR